MYIGIDLGTTGAKTVLFDKDGQVVCEYNKEYELIFKGTYVEQDANDWWRLVLEGMKHVVGYQGHLRQHSGHILRSRRLPRQHSL